MQFEWVESAGRLQELAGQWASCDVLAVDTEFVRVDTFYPRPGLVQVGDGQGQYLIDPVKVTDFSALAPLFRADGPRKLLHSCYEDIEVLRALLGFTPAGIIDTQIAAAFLGHGLQIGYARLLLEELGVEIPKEEARSDWLQRPLSQAQLEYAAQDVYYLLPVAEKLEALLREQGHWEKVEEDNRLMLDEMDVVTDPQTAYRDVANAWRLRRQELAVLKALCLWREEQAVSRNLPRTFLIKSNSLFDLARQQPASIGDLSRIEGMMPKILRKEGQAILDVIAQAQRTPEDECPELVIMPWPREIKEVMTALRQTLERSAASLGLPAEVMLRKKHLEDLLESFAETRGNPVLSARLTGWRHEPVTMPLLACLESHKGDILDWYHQRLR